MRSLVAAALSLVVLGACAPDATSPIALQPLTSHQANEAGGAVIVRGTVSTFLAHLDTRRGLLSIHAPTTLCLGGGFNTAEAQFVTTPSEVQQFIAQLRSDNEQIAVYAATAFADAGMVGTAGTAGIGGIVDVGAFCAFLQSPALVASGSVRRVSVFSNASFSAHWTGAITSPTGESRRLTEVYQLGASVHDPNNPATWVVHASKVQLR
ncbi:MAG TPA: hypothetical protein VGA37_06850 [Gemmatimonadales bacterium]